jgi:hypothetical protein
MKWGSANPLGQARASPFEIAISRFDSCRPSQAVRRVEKLPLIVREMPANSGFLRIGYRSPGSQFGHLQEENAESLRPNAGIFPFSGDRHRRRVSIHTAWRGWQC